MLVLILTQFLREGGGGGHSLRFAFVANSVNKRKPCERGRVLGFRDL